MRPWAPKVSSLAVVPLVAAIYLVSIFGIPGLDLVRSGLAEEETGPAVRRESRVAESRETVSAEALRWAQESRSDQIRRYTERFGTPAELAGLIFDAARSEGIRPDLAFRLVEIESSFRQGAVGPAGAVGFTQVLPSTARWLQPGITRERLFEARTNLELGFRYLRMLLDRYDNDTRLALLAYNRGPGTVAALLAIGQDPANGYARRILGMNAAESVSPTRSGVVAMRD